MLTALKPPHLHPIVQGQSALKHHGEGGDCAIGVGVDPVVVCASACSGFFCADAGAGDDATFSAIIDCLAALLFLPSSANLFTSASRAEVSCDSSDSSSLLPAVFSSVSSASVNNAPAACNCFWASSNLA